MRSLPTWPGAALLLTLLAPTSALAGPSTLELAYQKEHAFLLSERGALQRRLLEVDADASERLSGLQDEVDRLQGRLLAMAREADDAEELLDDADRAGAAALESADLVASTLSQARGSLDLVGDDGEQASVEQLAAQLAVAFGAANERIEQGRGLREEPGSFFLADGTRVEGTLLQVGAIGSYGIAGEHAGALAPLGEGRMVLRDPEAAADARALLAGSRPATLGIFLHESLEQAAPTETVRHLSDIMEDGGVIGWIIAVLGFLGLLAAIARTVSIRGVAAGANRAVVEIAALVENAALDAALARCERGGAMGELLSAVLANRGRSRAALEDLLSEGLLRVEPRVKRFGAELRVIAAVAPLLGLLGTVTGMIATFEVITEFGTGDPKMLSGGISAALVTTQLGLVVAIPMLLVGNVLSAWSDGVLSTLEEGALRVLNALGALECPTAEAEPPRRETPVPATLAMSPAANVLPLDTGAGAPDSRSGVDA